jgi:O-antigen ligase
MSNQILLIGISLITLVFSSKVYPRHSLPKLVFLILVSFTLLYLISSELLKGHIKIQKSISVVITFYLICLTVVVILDDQNFQTLLLGPSGRYTGLLANICYIILFFYIATSQDSQLLNRIVQVFYWLGAMLSIYGAIQLFNADPIDWNLNDSRILLTLGNSNFSATFISLGATMTLHQIFTNFKNRYKLFTALFVLILQLLLIYNLKTDQGYALTFIGFYTFITGFILTHNQFSKKVKILWLVQIFMFLSVSTILYYFKHGPFYYILNVSSFVDRIYSWKVGLEIFRDNIFTGVGLDSFGEWYPQYRTQEIIDFRALPLEYYVHNPHNILINFAVGGGLLLLVPYLLLIFFILVRGFKALQLHNNNSQMLVIFSMWIVFQSQTLISIDNVGISSWGWIFAGALVAQSYPDDQSKIPKSIDMDKVSLYKEIKVKSLILIVFLICAAPVYYAISYFKVNYDYFQLTDSYRNPVVSAPTSIQLTGELIQLDSKIYQIEIREITLNLLLTYKKYDLALEVAKRMTVDFPRRVNGWDAVAKIYEFKQDYSASKFYRLKTLELDPLNTNFSKLLR